jgi:flagellar L-ring protein precursor FlgH
MHNREWMHALQRRQRVLRRAATVLAMASLASCNSTPPQAANPSDYDAPVLVAVVPRTEGAIYGEGQGLALFADVKARQVGDLLTVELQESTSASKTAKTSATKNQETVVDPPILFGRPVTVNGTPVLQSNLSASRDFSGEGDSSQSNRLIGNITVTVVQRLPNGNLVIHGEKRLTLNQGDETIRITGVVRPADISTGNVVPSYKLADAKISYSGRGFVAASNQMGWLARFFNSGWAPY